MDLDELRQRACIRLALLLPQVSDPSRLMDECLASARHSFRDEFIAKLSPEAWAHIALLHATTFLDCGVDLSVGDLVATVLRDSIHLHRIDMLSQDLAQRLAAEAPHRKATPNIRLVRPSDGS
jgi:hypothetical protein